MFGRLMPKEVKYFDLFNAHAEQVALGGAALTRLIEAMVHDPAKAEPFAEEIDRVERAADEITHSVLAQLHTSFITPFDRDEIHQLINEMDNILDVIQDVAESISLYDIQNVPAVAKDLAEVTNQSCQRIQTAVALLPSMQNAAEILRISHEVAHLESDADRILREAMSRLFREEPDVRQVIKLKAIYELLESVTDRCKDVSGTLEAIVLENS